MCNMGHGDILCFVESACGLSPDCRDTGQNALEAKHMDVWAEVVCRLSHMVSKPFYSSCRKNIKHSTVTNESKAG